MAQLRMIALAAIALAGGCNAADATTVNPLSATIAPPSGWTRLDSIATAARDAAAAGGATVRETEAYGDAARGCYAVRVWLEGRGASADVVVSGLTGIPEVGEAGQLTVTDVQRPEGQGGYGLLRLRFARPGVEGRLSARILEPGVNALACFSTGREPAGCAAVCTTILTVME
jgi:hypothetical protein